MQVPVGPVTRGRAKKFKEGLMGLLQAMWIENGLTTCSKMVESDPKVINVVEVKISDQVDHVKTCILS